MTIFEKEIIGDVQNEFDDLLDFVVKDSRNQQAYEVEKTIWKKLLHMGYLLLKMWFQLRCEQYGQEPMIGDDNQNTPFLENKERSFFSIFGKFKIPRPYFYRQGVGGTSPLDELLGLGDDIYSDMLRQMHELLAVYTVYGKTVKLMDNFLGIKLSTRAVQQCISKDAVDVATYYDKQEAPAVDSEAEILVAQADGKGVPLIFDKFDGSRKIRKKLVLMDFVGSTI